MISSPAPGTCLWLAEDAGFREWCEAPKSRLFHVLAGPGCGKSVLAKYLVEENLPRNCNGAVILYYFFKQGQGDQDRATSAISSMLHQLFTQQPDANITSYALPKHEQHAEKLLGMFNELWNILLATISDMSSTIICVFDALDECNEQDRYLLMNAISDFYTGSNSLRVGKGILKFLFTSRPYQEVDFDYWAMGEHSNVVKLDGDDKSESIQGEINRVIELRVPLTIPKASRVLQQAMIEHLQSMNNRTYLWLSLILNFIKQHSTLHGTEIKLKKLIRQIPSSVDAAYEDMLRRSKDTDCARRLLSITLAARRPLSLSETKIALELTENKYLYLKDIDTESDAVFKDSVRNICGLILSVHDSKIYFLHETAREFLIQRGQETLLVDSLAWKRSILPGDAEALMAEACIHYLSMEDFQELHPWSLAPSSKRTLELLEQFTNNHPFLNYAANSILTHVGLVQDRVLSRFKELFLRLLPGHSEAAKTWLRIQSMSIILPSGEYERLALSLAAEHGLDRVVEVLLAEGASVNERSNCGGSPLLAASFNGHTEVVRILLRNGANVNLQDGYHNTALTAALEGEHTEAAKLLIEYGADVNLNRGVITALHVTAKINSEATLRLLIGENADINARNYNDCTALQEACRFNSIEAAEVLIELGADVNAQGGEMNTALQTAAIMSGLDMVELLLANGANPDLYGGSYHSALTHALVYGKLDIVRALLDGGAQEEILCPSCVEDADFIFPANDRLQHPAHPHYISALFVAVQGEYVEVVKYLLQRKPSVDELFEDALQYALDVPESVRKLWTYRGTHAKRRTIMQLLSDYKARSSDQ